MSDLAFGGDQDDFGSAANVRTFPLVLWKNETATFIAASDERLRDPTVPAPAALVFPFYGDRVVLADIVSRGWCIPSGHVEPGETLFDAVRREAEEEAGVTLGKTAFLGWFILTHTSTGQVRHAPTYIAEVRTLGGPVVAAESRGAQLVNIEDVADLYFSWDVLLAAVFDHAWQEKSVRFPTGESLAAFMQGGAD